MLEYLLRLSLVPDRSQAQPRTRPRTCSANGRFAPLRLGPRASRGLGFGDSALEPCTNGPGGVGPLSFRLVAWCSITPDMYIERLLCRYGSQGFHCYSSTAIYPSLLRTPEKHVTGQLYSVRVPHDDDDDDALLGGANRKLYRARFAVGHAGWIAHTHPQLLGWPRSRPISRLGQSRGGDRPGMTTLPRPGLAAAFAIWGPQTAGRAWLDISY